VSHKHLKEWFSDKLEVDYHQWRKTLPKGSRRGIRYKGMLTRLGGVNTMKQLLNSPANRRKRIEFGAEYWVIQPQFRPLFTAEQIKEAKRRWDASGE
jgi:hypothetical protein